MISLTPKKRFQETEEAANAFRKIVTSDVFQSALTQAIAEFSLTRAPSSDQLVGVRSFIEVLLNMSEVEQDMPQFPVKHISISPDLRRQTTKAATTPPVQRSD